VAFSLVAAATGARVADVHSAFVAVVAARFVAAAVDRVAQVCSARVAIAAVDRLVDAATVPGSAVVDGANAEIGAGYGNVNTPEFGDAEVLGTQVCIAARYLLEHTRPGFGVASSYLADAGRRAIHFLGA